MMYSSAVFEPRGDASTRPRTAKLDRVCRALELGPDDQLLEIGTGWGGLAAHAASQLGCRVTTTTISSEQRERRARVAEAGVATGSRCSWSDYRDLRGTYDKLVSIEMIEAVGWQYFDGSSAAARSLLEPGGALLPPGDRDRRPRVRAGEGRAHASPTR